MKITIDTKEDSYEDIQKAIRLLSSLVEGKEVMSNQGDLFDVSTPDTSQKNSDLFGNDSPSVDANKSSDIFGDDASSSSSESSDDSSSSGSSGDSGGSGGGIFNMVGSSPGNSPSSESTTEENTTETDENEEKEDITIDIPDIEEYR